MDRQVLISPYAMVAVNKEEQDISIALTKKQIEDSPPWTVTIRSRDNSRRLLRVLRMADVLERPLHVGSLSLHYGDREKYRTHPAQKD